ncbi:heavy metal translocating P-type ATPase [Luteolibacter algae]|uniref:P-type Zn(2+) transporter n=1 Tax=Luteolibacter algae TaxID=454151 RepID=A0ABW5D801_9BACT
MHQQTCEVTKSACGCEHNHSDSKIPQLPLVIASGILTGLGLLLQWIGISPEWVAKSFFGLATIAGGLLVFPVAWKALLKFKLDINVLMAVAVTGAWMIDEGAEAAAVVFLFSLSELLESWAGQRARKAVKTLLDLTPPTAILVEESGAKRESAVEDIRIGDEILIKSGSRIPLDAVVISGTSTVDQAPITGESVPVEKSPGASLYAGTINGGGSLRARVIELARDSKLSKIIELVGEAENLKPPAQRFVDKFAKIYTPAVFLTAIAIALAPLMFDGLDSGTWIYRSLVLLVIACPCALVIATPVSIVSGITSLARRGVLVKGGVYLEAVGKLRAIAVDKTGTITQGAPKLIETIPFSDFSAEEILRHAAAINTHSNHPIAMAINRAAGELELTATDFQAVAGQGAKAMIDGHLFFIGNHKMAHDYGICSPEIEKQLSEPESKGYSLAILGHAPHQNCVGKILGVISVADTLRPDASDALKRLHAAGIEKIAMLSGDNQRTVSRIASEAGIDEAHGDLMPEDKVAHVRRLIDDYGHVGMIGDGVNDAPALATANVGFAMGAIGSDTAIETADIALMQDDLGKVAEAVLVGKRTLAIIRFNIAFALIIKALFLLLAFTGFAGLWMAILADTGATLLVILNSLRLLIDQKSPSGG